MRNRTSIRKALEYLANKATPATSFPNVVLESPIMITETPDLVLDASNIENWNSTAKFRIQSSNTFGQPQLSFWYAWVNPNETFALINAAGVLTVNGFCLIGSDGGLFGGNRQSALTIDANLILPGNASPLSQPLQSQTVVNLSTNTGGLGSVGAIESQKVFDGYFLQLSEAIIPPGEMVLIEFALAMNYFSSDGNVEIDFSSGDFNILSPFASVTILS